MLTTSPPPLQCRTATSHPPSRPPALPRPPLTPFRRHSKRLFTSPATEQAGDTPDGAASGITHPLRRVTLAADSEFLALFFVRFSEFRHKQPVHKPLHAGVQGFHPDECPRLQKQPAIGTSDKNSHAKERRLIRLREVGLHQRRSPSRQATRFSKATGSTHPLRRVIPAARDGGDRLIFRGRRSDPREPPHAVGVVRVATRPPFN